MSTAASHDSKSSPKPAQVLKDSDFNWEDPLDLESDLTEEERMVRDTARGFAQDKLMPRVREAYRDGEVRPRICCRRWARSACSARPSRRNLWRRRAWAMSPTA